MSYAVQDDDTRAVSKRLDEEKVWANVKKKGTPVIDVTKMQWLQWMSALLIRGRS